MVKMHSYVNFGVVIVAKKDNTILYSVINYHFAALDNLVVGIAENANVVGQQCFRCVSSVHISRHSHMNPQQKNDKW